MTEDEFLNELSRYLWAVLRERERPGNIDFEDLHQEGMIHGWKDFQTGEYTKIHMMRRARIKLIAIDQDISNNVFTGKPPKSRDFRNTPAGQASREKVQLWVEEYTALHGSRPTGAQIAQGTGFSLSWVYKMKDYVAAPALPKNKYGDIDYTAFSTQSLPEGKDGDGEMLGIYGSMPSAETEYLHDTEGLETLNLISSKAMRTAVYLHFWLDFSFQDVAKHMGLSGTNADHKARNTTYRGVEALKKQKRLITV